MKSKRTGMTKKESEAFWNTLESASKYVDSWPDWKKEAFGLPTSQETNKKALKRKNYNNKLANG